MQLFSILDDVEYGEHQPVVKTFFSTTEVKEIRIVFRKEQVMKKHIAPHPIVVQVAKGCIDFGVNDSRYLLKEGMLITLEAAVPHDLLAVEDSIVRLSLHKGDAVKRVEQVIQ
ncbi:cupin domain-containing protein [Gynurincola endophyticus]|jgi:quercetin dioxygenase-like cupin family protein|uniref:cupin n=1 Tax=Gynurincola endophyticus TaxID=2479004 RepID=UPI000F8E6F6A|nr:cupin [Gynurincola endophyticus]